jgi:hypothetical protein
VTSAREAARGGAAAVAAQLWFGERGELWCFGRLLSSPLNRSPTGPCTSSKPARGSWSPGWTPPTPQIYLGGVGVQLDSSPIWIKGGESTMDSPHPPYAPALVRPMVPLGHFPFRTLPTFGNISNSLENFRNNSRSFGYFRIWPKPFVSLSDTLLTIPEYPKTLQTSFGTSLLIYLHSSLFASDFSIRT